MMILVMMVIMLMLITMIMSRYEYFLLYHIGLSVRSRGFDENSAEFWSTKMEKSDNDYQVSFIH